MKSKILILFLVLCAMFSSSFGQVGGNQWKNVEKNVAILEPIDKEGKVSYAVKLAVKTSLAAAIRATPGYRPLTRDFTDLMKEFKLQESGVVRDEDKTKMGNAFGASCILRVEVAAYDSRTVLLTASIIDLGGGSMDGVAEPVYTGIDAASMESGCRELAKKLLGQGNAYGNTGGSNMQGYGQPSGSNYTETVFGINMQMVYVEGGDFMMGCTSEQGSDCDANEKNVRRVTLDGFCIGKFEVTQGQWEKVMGTSIYQQKSNWGRVQLYGAGTNYPMYYVSWEEATAFCEELSRRTGKRYRLPTEAEWEYAARGGNKNERTRYSGSSLPDAVAWHGGNSGGLTHPVGTKRSNILGLYDMSGNVWEWCRDWYSNTYNSLDTKNPKGPYSGTEHVIRGGSAGDWMAIVAIVAKSIKVEMKGAMEFVAEEVSKGLSREEDKEELELMEALCRVACRTDNWEDEGYGLLVGFRVVCEL